MSEHYNADPYALSLKARKRFREEKKIEQKRKKSDDLLKDRYGLPAGMSLLEEDEEAKEEARIQWQKAKLDQRLRDSKRRKTTIDIISIPASSSRLSTRASASSGSDAISSLRSRILQNTAKSSALGSAPSS